jgi:hypothetical protein
MMRVLKHVLTTRFRDHIQPNRNFVMAYDPAKAIAAATAPVGRYKDGECWTLMEDAVVGAGGKSSKVLTPKFAPDASFVWGAAVTVANLKPGDVLQFSAYKWEQSTLVETTFVPPHADNPNTTETVPGPLAERGAPQHSAMVVQVIAPGVVDVVEQNIPPVTGPVQTFRLVLIAGRPVVTTEEMEFETAINNVPTKVKRTIKKTTTEVVSFPPKCYRPAG